MILNCALFVVLVGFNSWHWFLAMSGMTSVEYWKTMGSVVTEPYDFSFERISDNLFNIFGTTNFVRMFSPSLRNVPLVGLEWSFWIKEMGLREDCEMEIEGYEGILKQMDRDRLEEERQNNDLELAEMV